MYFLIGVGILIVFVLIMFFYIKYRIRRTLDSVGFAGKNLKDIIEEARLEDQEVPKSLASMDSIYLRQIVKDFPDIHINELKSDAEKVLLDSYKAIEKKDSSLLKGQIKSFVDKIIQDYHGKESSYDHFKIHNTVVSNYKKERGIATITFSSAFEYYLNGVKTQDRAKLEYIYVYDLKDVPTEEKVLGIHCPNCGSPITSLGNKSCSYCGSQVKEIISRVFVCNNIVRY